MTFYRSSPVVPVQSCRNAINYCASAGFPIGRAVVCIVQRLLSLPYQFTAGLKSVILIAEDEKYLQ